MKKFVLIFIIISIPAYSQVFKSEIKKWHQGIIPYYFSGNINYTERQYIRDAMDDWENGTQLKFIEVAYPKTPIERLGKVHIIKTYQDKEQTQAWGESTVGYTERPYIKYLSSILYSNNKWTIKHELGHTIGLQHEHQRPDRDSFIWINWKMVAIDKITCYTKIDSNLLIEENYEYDYRSIMHYAHYSKIGKVIYEKNKQHIELKDITILDKQKVKDIYKRLYFHASMEDTILFMWDEYYITIFNIFIFLIVYTYIVIILREKNVQTKK